MHPLVGDLAKLKDSEVESKINELTRRYFSTGNVDLQRQVAMVLDTYREELARRQATAYENMMKGRNKDLDKLINVS